ncbi:MAG: hypothetical protein O7J95_11605 [Planctomycetota bacterium]|nr:hypothetical protein [Planctomycetota bacterium]
MRFSTESRFLRAALTASILALPAAGALGQESGEKAPLPRQTPPPSPGQRSRDGTPRGPSTDATGARARPLRELLESLRQVKRGPRSTEELAARLEAERKRLESELDEARTALRTARGELERLRKTVAVAEALERRLVSRREALRVAALLIRRPLPAATDLAALLKAAATSPEGSFSRELERDSRALFRKSVWPLFRRICHRCHGGKRQKSELRLLSREDLLRGGSRGAAVVPGKPERSLLWLAVARKKEPHMPPSSEIDPDVIKALERWIVTGAFWENASAKRGAKNRG